MAAQVTRPGEAKKKSRSLPSFGRSGPPLGGIFKSFEQEDGHRRRHSGNSSSSISDTSCSSVEFLTPQKWFSQGFLPSYKKRSVYASAESLTRRERLDAVKARVAAERRARCRDSSSEEAEDMEEKSRHHSDEALGRSRSARTERYLKRRSQDEQTLGQLMTRQEMTWRDSDAYEIPQSPVDNSAIFQLNQNNESTKENRPENTRKKSFRSNSLCVIPAPSAVEESPKTHPFRGHQVKPLTVSTSYGLNLCHPSPCDSGLSSSPSIGRAPTPPPRSPQTKGTARHLQVTPAPLRPVSCSLETVVDSGRYSKSPTLTLQSETCSSGRSSPWVHRMVANYEKRHLESAGRNSSSNVYSYTDLPPNPTLVTPSGSVVYSYTDQAPRVVRRPSPLSAYMSDSQLMARNRSSIAVDQPTAHNWRSNKLFADPVASRRSQTPPPVSPRTPLVKVTRGPHEPPAPPVRRESSSFGAQRHRRSSENFEDALQELEEIYNSLKLNSDEDLLDRAERRDLPCQHQLLKEVGKSQVHTFANGYALTRSNSDGVRRHRTPPNRRSAIPDKVNDDMANRRLQKPERTLSDENPSPVSYMLYSPAYTPTLTVNEFFTDYHNKHQPDIEFDDLNYRKFVQSDGARVQAPHPPFGIPLNPLTQSSSSDYLKTKVAAKPVFRASKADPLRDDMAYRNLRKDYPMVNGHDPAGVKTNKQSRAVRSLSVNFSDAPPENQEFERAQSMSDLIAALEKESEKWESLGGDRLKVTHPPNEMDSSTETLTESQSYLIHRREPLKSPSARSPTPPIPTRRTLALPIRNNVHNHDFWSDSDVRQSSSDQVTPLDDKELDDLLSSLVRDTPAQAQDNLFNSLTGPNVFKNKNENLTNSASSHVTLRNLETSWSVEQAPAMTDAARRSPSQAVFHGAGGRLQGEGLSDSGQRVAKYKEERRRQIQESVREKQQQEGFLGQELPVVRRSFRQLSKQKKEGSPLEALNIATPPHGASHQKPAESAFSDRRRYISRDRALSGDTTFLSGKVRLTKAARLRAEATSSHIQASQVVRNGLMHHGSYKKVPESSEAEIKPGPPSQASKSTVTDVNYNVTGKSVDRGTKSASAESDGSCDISGHSRSEKVKDKSAKRKSNLNRAMVLEGQSPVPSDVPTPRKPRRTRRTSESSGSDSLKSKKSADLGGHPVSQLNESLKWSDSQRDSKSGAKQDHSSQNSHQRELSPKKKVTALKKPDIPVVFRQRSLTPPRTNPPSIESLEPRSSLRTPSLSQSPLNTAILHKAAVPQNESPLVFRRDDRQRWSTNSRYSPKPFSDKPLTNSVRHPSKSVSVSSDNSFLSASPDEERFYTPPETLTRESPAAVARKLGVAAIVSTSPVIYTVSVTTTATAYAEEENESHKCLPVVSSSGESHVTSSKALAPSVDNIGSGKEVNFKEDFSTSFHMTDEVIECESNISDTPISKKPFPILKRKSLEEKREDIQGILKFRSSREDSTDEESKRPPSSILKKRGSSEEKEPRAEAAPVHPILKRQSTEESDSTGSPVHSILKHKSLEESSSQPNEPKPILKKKSSMEEIPPSSLCSKKPILKKRSNVEEETDDKPKPILKHRSEEDELSEGPGIGRNRSDSDPRKSILKKSEEDFSFFASTSPSFRRKRRDSDEILSDSSLGVNQSPSNVVRRLSVDSYYSSANKEGKKLPMSILKKRSVEVSATIVNTQSSKEENDACKGSGDAKTEAVVEKPYKSVAELRSHFKVTSAEEPPYPTGSKMVHRRKNPRYRTQPITVGEFQEMDSLESVQGFRARVLKNASLNVFEQKENGSKNTICDESKKTEFPQHYRPRNRKDRRSNSRYRTLPVTLEEKHDAEKGMAGVVDALEGDPSKLSVSEKARLFAAKMQREKNPKVEMPVRSVPSRRTTPRKSRFQTQPVTTEEVRIISGLMKSLQKQQEEVDGLALVKPPAGISAGNGNLDSVPMKRAVNVKSNGESSDARKEVVVKDPKPAGGKMKDESSSEDSSSDEESNEDDDDDSKKVLTGGQSHILINSYGANQETSRDTRKITNLAVQRKLNASLRKKEERRSVPTESDWQSRHEILTSVSSSVLCDPVHRLSKEETLSVPMKSPSHSMIDSEKEGLSNVTIRERLAALQKNGEENWKKRVSKPEDSVAEAKANQISADEKGIIASRKSQLEVSSSLWQSRVEVKDAEQYTVAGKMGQSLSSTPTTPVSERKKKTPIPSSVKSPFKPPANAIMVMPPGFLPLSKSKSVPVATRDYSPENHKGDEEEVSKDRRVIVPRADNETFSSFFDSFASMSDMRVEISDEVFHEVASRSHQFLAQKRTVKMQRRHVATRNPIKALASRSDLREGYLEEKTGIAEMELKRIKIEEMAKNSNKSVAAVAGLVSTEDFTAVSLRKSNTEADLQAAVTLMQIKGRRHVQTRLMELTVKSVNHGDSYVLATPEAVYCWLGKYSNVIERSKASEVSSMFLLRKEIAFKETAKVITLDEEKPLPEKQLARFFELLGGKETDCSPAGPPEEDENYEASIIDTNMVYELEKEELIPYDDYWGHVPKIEMLDSSKVFVFDFGSEMYVWSGKQSAMGDRKVAMRLAQQLWDHGYDYTECDINPICPEPDAQEARFPKKGPVRPKWAILQKIYQNMEPVLFREKFLDWPNMARIIQVKGQESEAKAEAITELKPCDAKELLKQTHPEPDTVLEGSHLGRGQEYWNMEEKRLYEITTLAVKMWHVTEYEHRLLPRSSWGQFHMGDTYVFRWQYRIATLGREFSGKMSRHSFGGRDRCAYFFWQGRESTITEKGACALMTVELDEERGPHVRVDQGKESPCFLNLFDGEMVLYIGKREVEETNTSGPYKFFMIRGEQPSEVMLVEIERKSNSLRSRSSFVLMNVETGLVFVWHGAKSLPHTQENILAALNALIDKKPQEMFFPLNIQFEVEVIKEGSESLEFWKALNGHQEYFSLLNSTLDFRHAPRLFNLSSVSGSFEATEIMCSFRSENCVQAFPFLQSDLYGPDQPTLFLLDNEYEVYLWQGWWPEGTEEVTNVATGSAEVRWNTNRRCAMETLLQYCQEKCPSNPPQAFLVFAGLEPLDFTNLFPEWTQREDVAKIQTKEGKKLYAKQVVQDSLQELTRTHYSVSQLQARPLPEGVDPLRLEAYIAEAEFQDLFSMTKEEFYKMPMWKQNDCKKNLNLF